MNEVCDDDDDDDDDKGPRIKEKITIPFWSDYFLRIRFRTSQHQLLGAVSICESSSSEGCLVCCVF